MSKKPAARGDGEPDDQGVDPRRAKLRVHAREELRQQAVAGHGVEDAGLAIHQHQDDRGQADDRADLDGLGEPRPLRAEGVDRDRDRIGHVQRVVGDDQGHHDRHQDVDDRAGDERADDPERHVLGRVLGFLAGGRDRFEADVGEEDDRGGAQDSAPPELALFTGRRRDERVPIGRVGRQVREDDGAADEDEGDQHRHLDGDDDVVELGQFRHADDQQDRKRGGDQEGGKVEQIDDRRAVDEHVDPVLLQMMAGRPGQLRRYVQRRSRRAG